MKKTILLLCAGLVCVSCSALHPGRRSSVEMFNGENLDGWHVDVPKMDEDPNARNPFIV